MNRCMDSLLFSQKHGILKAINPRERYVMAYKVGEACVNCGSCDSECAVGAIIEKDNKRWIDPEKCVSCGACAGVCPTEAIAEE